MLRPNSDKYFQNDTLVKFFMLLLLLFFSVQGCVCGSLYEILWWISFAGRYAQTILSMRQTEEQLHLKKYVARFHKLEWFY